MTTHAQPRTARRLMPVEQSELFPVLAAEAPVAAPIVSAMRDERRGVRSALACFHTCSAPELSLLYVGSGIVPLRMEVGDAEPFAAMLVEGRYTKASIHGAAHFVLELWDALRPAWGPAKDERPDQLLLECLEAQPVGVNPPLPGISPLRLARPAEFARVLPAAAAMYTEELGADPMAAPYAAAYQRRVYRYLENGQTWVCTAADTGEIAFKADVVGREYGSATIQGVWTAPRFRGRGIAGHAMSALAGQLLEGGSIPSLVVNSYNLSARRVYARAGFVPCGDYATIMF
ncbi:GNAT family N-acetyltransferase [Dietzia sp.]|uniref:GNAT family N-acetyltransferase n=1 Tax=Dietzia sp. TaxID=1871616 RepID=UPI002FDA5104